MMKRHWIIDKIIADSIDEALKPYLFERMTRSEADSIFSKYGVQNASSLSKRDLTKARGKLASKHHPDRGGRNEDMRDINAAYDVLSGNVEPAPERPYAAPNTPPRPHVGGIESHWLEGYFQLYGYYRNQRWARYYGYSGEVPEEYGDGGEYWHSNGLVGPIDHGEVDETPVQYVQRVKQEREEEIYRNAQERKAEWEEIKAKFLSRTLGRDRVISNVLNLSVDNIMNFLYDNKKMYRNVIDAIAQGKIHWRPENEKTWPTAGDDYGREQFSDYINNMDDEDFMYVADEHSLKKYVFVDHPELGEFIIHTMRNQEKYPGSKVPPKDAKVTPGQPGFSHAGYRKDMDAYQLKMALDGIRRIRNTSFFKWWLHNKLSINNPDMDKDLIKQIMDQYKTNSEFRKTIETPENKKEFEKWRKDSLEGWTKEYLKYSKR